MLKRLLQLLIVLSAATGAAAQAPTAESVLDALTAKFTGDNTVSASFTVSEAQTAAIKGTIVLSGKMFTLTTPQMTTWFDGRTQWSYSPDLQEVNVTEPTVEELLQINPFAIIANFRNSYDGTIVPAPEGSLRVQLDARSPRLQIRRVLLTISRATGYPTEITLVSDRSVTIRVSGVKSSPAQPKGSFQFNAKKYPGVEIVDLR